MNLFSIFLLDIILLICPLLIYFLYVVYINTMDVKKSSLYLDFALITSYYFVIKFGFLEYQNYPILILHILLIIAYLTNRKMSIILLNILLILTNIKFYNLIFIIIEYLIYFILYLLFNKRKLSSNQFLFIYLAITSIFLMTYMSISNLTFIIIFLFILSTIIVVLLFQKIEDVISLYDQIKRIEKETNIKNSLFKITHEIKNPIAVCKGYLDMFDVKNIEHSKKYIPIIKSEINRVLVLLQDFLSITKIKIEKEEMDLNLLLEDTIDCIKPLFDRKKIKIFTNNLNDELYIDGDYDRLKQALINILKNSMEAIENKGTINLKTKINKQSVRITIEDNGCGMEDEKLKKLKEAFFTTKEKGTGLGVYLANEIIKGHGGKLEYSSIVGKGTKVNIVLPLN